MNNKIKVVFIDWYKTLSSGIFFDTKNIDNSIIEALKKALFIDNEHLLEPWMRGHISYKDIVKSISLSNCNLNENLIIQAFKNSCSTMKLDDSKFLSLISRLRDSGRKVIIATDNMDVFRLFTVPALGLESSFDDILSSHELGFLKQDTENGHLPFFDNYLKRNNYKPYEAILFDDCISTVNLCKSHGLNAVIIRSSNDLILGLEKILDQDSVYQ